MIIAKWLISITSPTHRLMLKHIIKNKDENYKYNKIRDITYHRMIIFTKFAKICSLF